MALDGVDRIGRYVDLRLLGQGGMGAVYRGRDPELDRPVAIKVMLDATPDFVARFRREAQAIARLQHGNIVQVYDFGVDEQGNPYFVMELIEGTALDAVVRHRGALPGMEAIRLIRQAAEGLAAAHRAGIVHRDVKPSNLIVDGSGHLKIVDFGIARVNTAGGAALTGAAALMGTPGYMAPEQAAGKAVDARADIYALGLTLYELLAGRPPYEADDPISLVVKNMQEPLPDLRISTAGLPEELVRLVEMMSAKSPDDRLQSCDAVMAALDDVFQRMKTGKLEMGMAATAMAATDQVPPTNVHARRADVIDRAAATAPPPRKDKNTTVIAAIAALVVLGGGAAGVVLMKKGGDPPPQEVQKTPDRPRDAGPVVSNARVTQTPPVRTGQGVAEGPLRVAVLKFKNVGADAKLISLEQGIGESALTFLAGASKDVTLIERADVDSDIKEIDRAGDFHFDALTVAKSGQLKGIELAVQGGFQKVGKQLRITARFVRVETGEVLDTLKVTSPSSDVFEAQDEVAKGLKTKLVALAAQEKAKR